MENLLATEEINTILQKSTDNENVKMKSIDIKPLSDTAEGFLGEHFIVTMEYTLENEAEVKTQSFFLKQLTKHEGTMFKMAVSIKAYVKEHFLYKVFLEECKKHPQIDASFAPRAYLSSSSDYKVILEDLSIRGFKTTPKKETLDLAHTKVVLEALAKFHGASIICEELTTKDNGQKLNLLETYPEELEEILFCREDNLATEWFKCSIDGLNDIIDFMPEDGVKRETFKAKLQDALENLYDIVMPSKTLRNTTTHGDLWTNNFMYRYENGIPVDCVIVDYQLLKYSPPSLDVVQLILTNTRKSLRDVHWRELLDHYYTNLKNVLEKANLNIEDVIPYEKYLESTYLFKIPAKLQAIADRSITFLDEVSLVEAAASSESFENFLYKDRSYSMLYSYKNNDTFREILGEDIVELRDILMNYTK